MASYVSFANKPITEACAYQSLKAHPSLESVQRTNASIEFASNSIKGNLFHGGETVFTRFGIELHGSWPLGPDLELVSWSLIEALRRDCEDAAL